MYHNPNEALAYRLSRHAHVRMQQRCIPRVVLDCLLDFSDPVDAGSGCFLYRFNADSWAEAIRATGGKSAKLDRYRNAYAIVAADGTVVTAARLH